MSIYLWLPTGGFLIPSSILSLRYRNSIKEVIHLRKFQWLLALVLLGSFGCAHLDIHKVDNRKDPDEYGLRFYRSRPYLLVTLSDKGCTATFEYLPDYSQEYILHPHCWLGSLSLKPTLKDGWNLTAFDSTVDTKIPETINAFAGVMKNVADMAKMLMLSEGETASFGPGLYSMTFDEKSGLLIDLKPVFQFKDSVEK